MTVAIFMDTKTHVHLLHGEGLDLTIPVLLDSIDEYDELEIIRIDVVDQFNKYSTQMEDKVWEAVLEFKNNREADNNLKQKENV